MYFKFSDSQFDCSLIIKQPQNGKKVKKEKQFLDLYSTNLVNTGLFRYVSFEYVNHPTQIGNSLQVKWAWRKTDNN